MVASRGLSVSEIDSKQVLTWVNDMAKFHQLSFSLRGGFTAMMTKFKGLLRAPLRVFALRWGRGGGEENLGPPSLTAKYSIKVEFFWWKQLLTSRHEFKCQSRHRILAAILYSFQIPFEYRTIWHLEHFPSLKYWTCSIFRSPWCSESVMILILDYSSIKMFETCPIVKRFRSQKHPDFGCPVLGLLLYFRNFPSRLKTVN